MFNDIQYSATAIIAASLALAITLAAFLAIVIRTLRMKRRDLERIASLPLEDDSPDETAHPHSRHE